MIAELTPRQQREREFYDQFSQGYCDTDVILDPITSPEHRPWNSYWHFFRLVRDRYTPGARLLDFGCGWGSKTVLFAKAGYFVEGFDISEKNIQVAADLAAKHEVADRSKFRVEAAESLSYPDTSFDVIAGLDILHHVQLEQSLAQCWRVLKPGGVAYFREPLENWLFDTVRNTWVMRKLFPNDASLDRHITHDEKKLTKRDLRLIRKAFPDTRIDRFRVLSRLAALAKRQEARLEKVDLRLRWIPGFTAFAGSVVLTMRKEA